MGFKLNLVESTPKKPRRSGPVYGIVLTLAFLLIGSCVAFIGDNMLAGGRYSSLLISDAGATWHHTSYLLRGLLGP